MIINRCYVVQSDCKFVYCIDSNEMIYGEFSTAIGDGVKASSGIHASEDVITTRHRKEIL